jgi:hypothetical protein
VQVTLSGAHFTDATAVYFGDTPTSFTVDDDNTITATVPAHGPGTVDVTVVSGGGTSAMVMEDQFNYVDAPVVSGVTPGAGSTAGDTVVTLTGSLFTGATGVTFGATATDDFIVDSDTQMTVVAPPQAAGTVAVTVTTVGGTSPGAPFTYIAAPAPVIDGIDPAGGSTAGGTVVTISGSHLLGATGVAFGSTPAGDFRVLSDTMITATAPAHAAGTVDVSVTTYGGGSAPSASDWFTYTAAPAPAVTGVSTALGYTVGGTAVTITGSNFTGATAVTFGDTAAMAFTVDSDTQITATGPAHVAGTVDVTVTTYSGTSDTSPFDEFSYSLAPAPAVSGIDPPSGPAGGGTAVTLSGSHFSGATGVSFGATPAVSFTVVSDRLITAIAPPHSAATVDVGVTTPSGTSATSTADRFTYVAAPAVTAIGPTAGTTAGGTLVTVSGSHFTGATAVLFGTTPAAFTVNGDGSLTATAPPEAEGTVDITVVTAGGSSAPAAADQFTYVAAPAPAVTGVSPATGLASGNILVTITGNHFTGATAVSFGTLAAVSFTVNSDTQVTATAPAQAPGSVDVTVTTFGGTSDLSPADQFTYLGVPSVFQVWPAAGPAAGGTAVRLLGTNFRGITRVTFGSLPATDFMIDSDTQITAVAPPQAGGVVDVTVANPLQTSAVSPGDRFTYVPLPAVTGIAPAAGLTLGGTVVTLTGSHFTGASSVKFGAASTTFRVDSDTSITAWSPAHAAGTVDVTVTTGSGSSPTMAADQFTYVTTPPPAVTGISPTSGFTVGGTLVTVSGSHFTGTTAVAFGTVAATWFTILSDSSLTVLAPAHAAGRVDITVTTAYGTSTPVAADQFLYVATPAPAVTNLAPRRGPWPAGPW